MQRIPICEVTPMRSELVEGKEVVSITSRERVRAVVNNRVPDRVPFNFWMDRDLMAELDVKYGENFRVCYYDADVIESFLLFEFFPEAAKNAEYKNDGKTIWTVHYPARSVTELKDASYPDPDCPDNYRLLREDRAKYPDKAIFAFMVTPLDILFAQMGMEQFFYDTAEEDELIDEIIDRISQIYIRALDHIVAIGCDVLYVLGDICSSKSQMMSNNMLRRFCFEPIKKIVNKAHELGLKVFYHTDGYVMDILPLFVEYGLDGINPFQISVGNDINIFMEEYASKLMIYGGIDNLFIIPNGTIDDVRAHIRYLFNTLGRNGRFIASSHDIPSYVPMANVDAMVDEIKKCRYG